MTPVLPYARHSSRRWRWWAAALLAVVLAGVGWRYGPAARQRLDEWNRARLHAQRFDAVARLAAERPWCWDGNPDRNRAAAELIRSLRGHYDDRGPDDPLEEILFIRAGGTGGRRWVGIGFAQEEKLFTNTFYRDEWDKTLYRSWVADIGPMQPTGVRYVGEGDVEFELSVTIDGTANTYIWKRRPSVASQANAYIATPATGIRVNNGWQPEVAGVQFRTLPQPTTLPTVYRAESIAFAGDGQLVTANRTEYGVVDIATGTMTYTDRLPPPVAGRVVFSPDGTKLLMSGQTQSQLIDVTQRRSRQIEAIDVTSKFYADSRILNAPDNWAKTLHQFDWDTGRTGQLHSDRPHYMFAIARDQYLTQEGTTLSVRSLLDQSVVATVQTTAEAAWASLSPDGRWLLASSGHMGMELHNTRDKTRVWRLRKLFATPDHVTWSADGSACAVMRQNELTVIGTYSPRWVAYAGSVSSRAYGDLSALALSRDGRQLVASGKVFVYWSALPPATRPAE